MTACSMGAEAEIERVVEDFYERALCRHWQRLLSEDGIENYLKDNGFIELTDNRQSAGVMGYALQQEYRLTNLGQQIINKEDNLCYGRQEVADVKMIDFDHDTQAIASFVLKADITEKWADAPVFEKLLPHKGQLRRVFVQKNTDGDWVVNSKFIPPLK